MSPLSKQSKRQATIATLPPISDTYRSKNSPKNTHSSQQHWYFMSKLLGGGYFQHSHVFQRKGTKVRERKRWNATNAPQENQKKWRLILGLFFYLDFIFTKTFSISMKSNKFSKIITFSSDHGSSLDHNDIRFLNLRVFIHFFILYWVFRWGETIWTILLQFRWRHLWLLRTRNQGLLLWLSPLSHICHQFLKVVNRREVFCGKIFQLLCLVQLFPNPRSKPLSGFFTQFWLLSRFTWIYQLLADQKLFEDSIRFFYFNGPVIGMIRGMDTFETIPVLWYFIKEPIQLVCKGFDLKMTRKLRTRLFDP